MAESGQRPRRRRRPWIRWQRRAAEVRLAGVNRVRALLRRAFAPARAAQAGAGRWIEPRRRWVLPILAVVGLAFAAVLPLLDQWFELPGWMLRATSGASLAKVGLFALFALGLNVVVGFAGLLDLGYVAFWAIGSYTAAFLTGAATYAQEVRRSDEIIPEPQWQMWMWLILLAALVVAVFAGALLGSPTLRLRGDYLAIVTLGFGEIVRVTANNLASVTGGPRGISNIPHPAIDLGVVDLEWKTFLDDKYYWLLLVLVVFWIVAITRLDRSRIGRAWVAIREDEVAAAAMGVPVVRMKIAAFVIGASTAGVGGVVYAEQINSIAPGTFIILQSILILAMVVIGGMGSIPGAILGAALVVLLPEIFREFASYRFLVFGLALVLLMIFRPQGLLPSKRRKAELKGAVVEEQLFDAGGGEPA
ncbi:MAG: branched-chain amino acid ABC transporter permease [Actinomycetota bacterium]